MVDLRQYDRLIETQTSRLYFKGDLIYKVKKKVSDHFVSYLSKEERAVAVEREFAKGIKYSPRLYREIVAAREPGESECEAAICMNYLGPRYKTLFSHLRRSPPSMASVDGLLRKLKDFHSGTRACEEAPAPALVSMERRCQLLLTEAESLGVNVHELFVEGCERFVDYYQSQYPARLAGGYVRELHGDLHTANILFCDEDFIFFDFLDFEEGFAVGDIAIDLGFLASDFCSREESFDRESLFLLIDNLFKIDLKTLLPLTALGLLNRANTFRARADGSRLAREYYGAATSVMEKYRTFRRR